MRRRLTPQRLGCLALALGVAVALTAWLSVASTHAYAPNADGATVVLEGSALIHGNLLLHGWSLSLDSFWTVDALLYALGVALIGVQPLLMHLVPAAIAALCVMVGAMLAGTGLSRRARIFAALVVFSALALPSHTGAYFLLQGPWHVLTTLYCLLAVALLARATTYGWRWIGAVALLVLGLSGDLQMLSLGVVPIFVAGLLGAARARSIRAGVVLITASIAACVVAIAVRVTATAIGTFGVHESHHTVGGSQLSRDVGHLTNWLSALFGVHLGPVPGPAIAPVFAIARAAVLVGLVGALVWVLVTTGLGMSRDRPDRHPWLTKMREQRLGGPAVGRVDDLLLCMTLGALGTFGLLTLSDNPSYARYLDPVMIFLVVLGARVLGRLVGGASGRVWEISLASLVLVAGLGAVSSIRDSLTSAPSAPSAPLERYLIDHHLYLGVGDYWASSIVTVDTRERVTIRPVVADPAMRIVPDGRQATIDWYRNRRFAFLVYTTRPHGHVNRVTAERTFGQPLRIVRIGQYFVVTWSHPIALRRAPFP